MKLEPKKRMLSQASKMIIINFKIAAKHFEFFQPLKNACCQDIINFLFQP